MWSFLGRSLSRYCRELRGYMSMYRWTNNYKYSYRSIALALAQAQTVAGSGSGPAKNYRLSDGIPIR